MLSGVEPEGAAVADASDLKPRGASQIRPPRGRTPKPFLTSTLSTTACSQNTFAYTPVIAPAGGTFTWTRAAVVGISNAAVTVPQSVNPNEVLINTTASAVNVVYLFS